MKTKKTIFTTIIICMVFTLSTSICIYAQKNKSIVYDASHGQSSRFAEIYQTLLPSSLNAEICLNEKTLNQDVLTGKQALILFGPKTPFQEEEVKSIQKFLTSGGSLLLIFDEERRMSLDKVGVNKIIAPFGIQLTGDTPAPHNCGAIAEKSIICAKKRELPYSGGRSITGGNIISKVYAEGNYAHSAYVDLPDGGKIIVMSDGMAGLLMGEKNGERLKGTNPSDTKYWGKDSRDFMKEILFFLVN